MTTIRENQVVLVMTENKSDTYEYAKNAWENSPQDDVNQLDKEPRFPIKNSVIVVDLSTALKSDDFYGYVKNLLATRRQVNNDIFITTHFIDVYKASGDEFFKRRFMNLLSFVTMIIYDTDLCTKILSESYGEIVENINMVKFP